jgi:hypothetical protein
VEDPNPDALMDGIMFMPVSTAATPATTSMLATSTIAALIENATID